MVSDAGRTRQNASKLATTIVGWRRPGTPRCCRSCGMPSPFVSRCAAWPCRTSTVSLIEKVAPVQVLPVAARIAITICAHGVSCLHPASYFTQVRGRRGTDPRGEVYSCGAFRLVKRAAAVIKGLTSNPRWRGGGSSCHGHRMFETVKSPTMPRPYRMTTASESTPSRAMRRRGRNSRPAA
jgi:hypothetical protein